MNKPGVHQRDMAEKVRPSSLGGNKPIPMKLFAAWEVDRTPPYCIPRLCTMTVSHLSLSRPLSSEMTFVVIAVKMQSSKRTLRSNEIPLGGAMLDTDLDLTFSLQYPHFLKRDGNVLVVLMQRRKRYKNRAILGYKTLAEGTINMAQVLQRPMDLDLELLCEPKEKEKCGVVAKVSMVSVCSQPVDQEEITFPLPNRHKGESGERGVGGEFSDDEEDYSTDDGTDSEPTAERKGKNVNTSSIRSMYGSAQQRNLKQKFISLLKRFKVTEDLQSQDEIEKKLTGDMDAAEIEDLFSELDDLSDSGPEIDTMSISSTPKPSLRPFFASCRSLVTQHSDNAHNKANDNDDVSRKTDSDYIVENDIPAPTLSPSSSISKISDKLNCKVVLEQLSHVLPPEDTLPDHVIMVNSSELQGSQIAARLQEKQHRVIITAGNADVRATFTCIVGRIQKFCNSNAKAPPAIKVLIAGGDSYVNAVVRAYVDQLSSKAPDWQSYIKFFVVPIGSNSLCKYLGSIDATYSSSFLNEGWKEVSERGGDTEELVSRLSRYLNGSSSVMHIPIAEAMITYKEKSSDEESTQVFVPFIIEVCIGVVDGTMTSQSIELEEPGGGLSGSPPSHPLTPPSSPSANSSRSDHEPMELQLDYWLCLGPPGTTTSGQGGGVGQKSKTVDVGGGKSSLKAVFRSLQVQRLPQLGDAPSQHLALSYSLKEKKQKIMRLGKKKEKEKESDVKSQLVDAVSRLICLGKTQNMPLKVYIDGMEWNGVKFFQLSSQWQTHVKYFPVALFTYADSAL